MDYVEIAKEIINSKEGIIAAYGYGSSFFHQAGYNSKVVKSMDFIFVVDDIKSWFKKDIELHPEDYTKNAKKKLLKLSKKKLKGCTNVIYNVIRDREIKYKYGVIEKSDFIDNLTNWNSFYITGRMHKPVYTFKSTTELDNVIDLNRQKAYIVSLLILNKEKIKTTELFETLCSLSYKGDIRFIIENPNKVSNIVKGSLDNLISLYSKYQYTTINKDNCIVDLEKLYNNESVKSLLNKEKTINEKTGIKIMKQIKHINFKESIKQPLKGLKVTGIKDSLSYVREKAKKKKIK